MRSKILRSDERLIGARVSVDLAREVHELDGRPYLLAPQSR